MIHREKLTATQALAKFPDGSIATLRINIQNEREHRTMTQEYVLLAPPD
jgi:hypothetical protein